MPRGAELNARRVGWWLVALQFVGIALLIAPVGEPLWQLPAALGAALQLVGWLSLAALLLAGLTLGRGLTAHPMPVARGDLVTRGLYRLVRHPIYSSLLLAALAIAIGDPTPLHLLAAAGLFGLINFKARFEEALLDAAYPGYAAYAARTGRFLPRLRSAR